MNFYRRAFGLEIRFFDETLGFAEFDTGGSTLAIASHSLGEVLMQDGYSRPADGHPAGVEIAFITRDVPASFTKAIKSPGRVLDGIAFGRTGRGPASIPVLGSSHKDSTCADVADCKRPRTPGITRRQASGSSTMEPR